MRMWFGMICFALVALIAWAMIVVGLGPEPTPGHGGGGKVIACAVYAVAFWLLLFTGYAAMVCGGGLDWLGIGRGWQHTLACIVAFGIAFTMMLAAGLYTEPIDQLPYVFQPIIRWAMFVLPVIAIAAGVLALDAGWRGGASADDLQRHAGPLGLRRCELHPALREPGVPGFCRQAGFGGHRPVRHRHHRRNAAGPVLSQLDRLHACETVVWEGWVHYPINGSRYVQETVIPYRRAGEGAIIGFIGIARDLTDLKLREKELAEQVALKEAAEAYHAAVVRTALDGVVVIDRPRRRLQPGGRGDLRLRARGRLVPEI